MRWGGVGIGFSFGRSDRMMHILAPLFLLLLDGIFSTFTVFENLTLIFRWSFVVLRLCSIARERAVTKHMMDSWLDTNDFVIHSSGFKL